MANSRNIKDKDSVCFDKTIVLSIQGMSCLSCVGKIEAGLKGKNGVIDVNVNLGKNEAWVHFDSSLVRRNDMADTLAKLGYPVTQMSEGSECFENSGVEQYPIFKSKGPYIKGGIAAVAIVGFYLGLLTLTSDWYFARVQFEEYRMWIILLAIGLGIQVFLYSNLRQHLRHLKGAGKTVAVSGGLSTAGMAACCAHYLVTVLPVLGIPFVTTAIAALEQYQIVLFLIGVISNMAGILYMLNLMNKNHMLSIPGFSGSQVTQS